MSAQRDFIAARLDSLGRWREHHVTGPDGESHRALVYRRLHAPEEPIFAEQRR